MSESDTRDLQLENTLRELKSVKDALDQSAIVAITDRAGLITHVNDKFCEISKYSRDELLGQNHRILNSGHHPREFFVELWKTISAGTHWEGEIRNRAKDGSYYWVNTHIVPFLDSAGRPYQYVSIRFEITDRKIAEEQLRVYANRLEQSNRELQDFASIAAHDLQEPLRKVRAFGDRLQSKYRDALGEQGKDYLDRMLGSAERMQALIEALLTYSRVSTRGGAFSRTDLNAVMNDVIADLEVRIEQTGGRVIVDPLPTIDADPLQLRQMLQNLVSNALKFQKEGTSPEIHVKAAVEGDVCEIRVTDNGIGFDGKYLDRIFTIFQRLHGRHEYEGTGLGLAVVRRIVERHHGTITAESAPGAGATFVVRLPARQTHERS